MVDQKKPAKPAPATPVANPTATPTANERRPPLPPLTPLPDEKPAATSALPVAPSATTGTPDKANQPASTDPQPTAGPTSPAKPTETLGPKLRAKGDIIAALRAGAHVLHTESGLYRVVAANSSVSPASKRRILSLIQQGILKVSGEGNGRIYILDVEGEKKASEKPAAKSVESGSAKAEGTK